MHSIFVSILASLIVTFSCLFLSFPIPIQEWRDAVFIFIFLFLLGYFFMRVIKIFKGE